MLEKLLAVFSKHSTLECSFQPTVKVFFVFNQIFATNCLFARAMEVGTCIEHSAQLRSIYLQFLVVRGQSICKSEKTDLQVNL